MRYLLLIYAEEPHRAVPADDGRGIRRLRRIHAGRPRPRHHGGRRGASPDVERHDGPGPGTAETVATDGPFAETKEALGGFYLIDAKDLDEAIETRRQDPGRQARLGSRSARSGSSPRARWTARPRRPSARPAATLTGPSRPALDAEALAPPVDPHAVVDRLFREEQGRAVATLIRVLGDFDLAEEAVQEAFVTALEVWPDRGVPDNPGAWITTTAPEPGDRPAPAPAGGSRRRKSSSSARRRSRRSSRPSTRTLPSKRRTA